MAPPPPRECRALPGPETPIATHCFGSKAAAQRLMPRRRVFSLTASVLLTWQANAKTYVGADRAAHSQRLLSVGSSGDVTGITELHGVVVQTAQGWSERGP